MGKRSRKVSENEEQKSNGNGEVKKSILVDEEAVDPSLALLFSSSVIFPPEYYCYSLQTIY
jgi:nucleolar protein 12